MRVNREARKVLRRLEAHVIVAVRNLRFAAGIDDVELGGDLIVWPEPGFARKRDDGIAVIGGEGLRIGEAKLFERVPDLVVGAGLGEMVAVAEGLAPLRLDDRPEMAVCRLDLASVCEGPADDDDAWAVRQRLRPLRHQFAASSPGRVKPCERRPRRRPACSTPRSRQRGRRRDQPCSRSARGSRRCRTPPQ